MLRRLLIAASISCLMFDSSTCRRIPSLRTSGTILVWVGARGTVNIAIDGRVNHGATHSVGCKVRSVEGRYVYAVAGLAHDPSGFDSLAILQGLVRQHPTTSALLAAYERSVIDGLLPLVKNAAAVRQLNADLGSEKIHTAVLIESTPAGATVNELMFSVDFGASGRAALGVERNFYPQPSQGAGVVTSIHGVASAVKALEQGIPLMIKSTTMVEWPNMMKSALDLIMDLDPRIGPPVSVVRVTSTGIEWLTAGACVPGVR